MLMEERLKTARESYVLLWHSCRHVPNMETQYRYLYIADHINYGTSTNLHCGDGKVGQSGNRRGAEMVGGKKEAALDSWGGGGPGIGIVIRYFTLEHLTHSYYLHN